jgi:hypothetical protein
MVRVIMPEGTPATLFLLCSQLRAHLLRAAEALADERYADAEALALTRNAAAAVLAAVDAVASSPLLAPVPAA